MTIRYPQPMKFHKKIAQLQVDLVRPKEEVSDNNKARITEGCLLISIARALDDNSGKMDWANKILMKLNSTDVVNILCGMRTKQFPIKLIHKYQGDTSYLEVSQGERPGTFKWMIGKTIGEQKKFASIYLDAKDMYHLAVMLDASLPITAGWME